MISGIYLIRNRVNGKCYVGSSVNVPSRWSVHQATLNGGTHFNKYLQRSWKKHGKDAFEFSVLESCSIDQLAVREQYWMGVHGVLTRGYNLQPIARSSAGIKHSAETIAKLSLAAQKRSSDPEHRKHLSERAKRQWSEGRIGWTKDTPREIVDSERQKMSDRTKKMWADGKLKGHSEETRKKMSATWKAKFAAGEPGGWSKWEPVDTNGRGS